MNKHFQHDVLIIGTGAAGLTLALQLPKTMRVAVICKGKLNQGSTFYAQGGIAAVLDTHDSVQSHVTDTLNAGANLCHTDAVTFTVENSNQAIQWLVEQGVEFSRNTDQQQSFHLTKEGGHSQRRIIHAADATGKAVSETLTERALAADNIEIYEQRVAIDLIINNGRCQGLYALNETTDHVDLFQAKSVAMATGGASKAYLYTSNPDGASGDGIAMAWRAGCRVANMEFNQFHPTCLYHSQAKSFLITEAIRGEGGKLLLPDGERFMQRFDERGELAPRDVVARAIDHEMKRLGSDCVYLDISHKSPEFLLHHFPTVKARCLELGIDITRDPIPVVPAAHYTCGGVMVDSRGRTDIDNLYAIGETSFTGLHGANRMASNSLLECIVYGQAAARDIASNHDATPAPDAAAGWDESQVTNSDEDVVISHNWDELRRFMWDYVGIVRTDKRLQRALRRAKLLQQEINEYYRNYKVSNDLIELRNLAMVAELIIRSAICRKESRGLHYTLDYPELLAEAKDTILDPNSPE
jgi:L-aspartate oxidase